MSLAPSFFLSALDPLSAPAAPSPVLEVETRRPETACGGIAGGS